MDINLLLAREQASLLRARFAPPGLPRDRHLAEAASLAGRLGASSYPHRPYGFAAGA